MLNIKKVIAVLTSSLLLAGTFGMAVSATGGSGEASAEAEAYITKKLVMDDAVENYPAFTFEFELEQQFETEVIDQNGDPQKVSDTEVNLTASITYKGTLEGAAVENTDADMKDETDSQTGLRTVTQKVAIKNENGEELTGADFEAPGIYVYKVTEKELTEDSWEPISDYDSVRAENESYTIVFQVTRNEDTNELEISSVAILDETKTKVDTAEFTNIYQRDDNPPPPDDSEDPKKPETYAFQISKEVTGDLSNPDEEFTFHLTVTRNATETDDAVYTGTIVYTSGDEAGQQVPETGVIEVSFGSGNTYTKTFKLKDNQTLAFDDFPVGTGYAVSETVPDGYTALVAYVQGGIETEGVSMANFSTKSLEIREGDNRVAVENNNQSTPLTGIVTDNFSFILLIAAAVIGMGAYVVLKKRLRNY